MYIQSHPVTLLSQLVERRFHAVVPFEKQNCQDLRLEGAWILVASSKIKGTRWKLRWEEFIIRKVDGLVTVIMQKY